MRVLFVCPFVPWPRENGGKIRTGALLEAASKRVEIDLCVIDDGTQREDALEALGAHVHDVDWFPRGRASLTKRLFRAKLERWFHSPELAARLARVRPGDYDLVHLDEMLLVRTMPRVKDTPVVVHHHKLDRILYEKLSRGEGPKRHWDLTKLAHLERVSVARFPDQIFCSAEDAETYSRSHPTVRPHVLPSGFEPARFERAPFETRDARRLLFLGSMDYGPNVEGARWFVSQVLPKIEERVGPIVLELVGANPVAEVRALESARVLVTGRVPDVRPHLARTGAMLVPLSIGGGTRLKIVEALAMETPTVSTRIGAEGLGLVDGEHLALADSPDEFARATAELLLDGKKARQLAECGANHVRKQFPWQRLGDRLAEIWSEIKASSTTHP